MKNEKLLKILIICAAAIIVLALAFATAFLLKDDGETDKHNNANSNSMPSQETVAPPVHIPDDTSSTEETPETKPLVISSPTATDITVKNATILIAGSCEPDALLTLNGEIVKLEKDGSFSFTQTLNKGNNNFEFVYGDETQKYIVRYKYTIAKDCSPSKDQVFESGSVFEVRINALSNSTVEATFNGETKTLTRLENEGGADSLDEFSDFTGSFKLPTGNINDKNLGKVTFSVTCDKRTEKFTSGSITVKKDPKVNYIAEVVAFSAETFDGKTADDNSNPRNNYLPKGTVDYCDTGIVYYQKGTKDERTYYNLRCGRRVYINKENPPLSDVAVTKRYVGTLPDHNEISVNRVIEGQRHTVISFSTMWKAPFLLDLLPQKYRNESKQDFRFSEITYEYVEITFCYATKFSGTIDFSSDNKVFKSASVTQENGNTVLKLYLKKKGMFYGWDCEYDSNGNLVFSFLNPVEITETQDNRYGVDLSNAVILIDVGHGGKDPGSYGRTPDSKMEGERNLNLALLLENELKKTGATVIMNRTADVTLATDSRCEQLKKLQPDYCISIHHNALSNPKANGFGAYHGSTFSYNGAIFVNETTKQADIYGKCREEQWHFFYLARMTACPVILTENGFITNYEDSVGIEDHATNVKKAIALAEGVVDYFEYIQ